MDLCYHKFWSLLSQIITKQQDFSSYAKYVRFVNYLQIDKNITEKNSWINCSVWLLYNNCCQNVKFHVQREVGDALPD